MDEDAIKILKEEIKIIQERLHSIEIEQRRIREDILLGNPRERMQKRILENRKEDISEIKEKIEEQIKFEI